MAITPGRTGTAAPTAHPTTNALHGSSSLPTLEVRPNAATLEDRLASEWVLTNGLGGFAMGSASGVPRRRYHAWLVGALTPPVGRHVLLHSAAETFVDAAERRVDACSYQFIGHDLHPRAAEQQTLFRKHFTCLWEYEIKDAASNLHARFTRELVIVPGRNAAVVRYRVTRLGAGPLTSFDVRPMTPLRDFHALHPARPDAFTTQILAPAGKPGAIVQPVRVTTGNLRVTLALLSPTARAEFTQAPEWWYDFEYHKDRDRGQECIEDLYSPGVYRLALAGLGVGQTAEFFLQAWADEGTPPIESAAEFDALVASLADRHSAMLAGIRAHAASTGGAAGASWGGSAVSDEDLSLLVHAADQFIVRRDMPRTGGQAPTSVSVIAGYPWFSDWGRDTMISLPGLFYSTGRFAEARAALETFARLRRRGLIPNCFDDGTGTAMYNTVDAPLWFVHAACRYVEVTGDKSVIDGPIFAAALDVLDAYKRGTDFDIRMDPADGLITAGDASMQLTWMDAKRDGVVFTPRHGKAVEINALWYNALVSVAELVAPTMKTQAAELSALAQRVKDSFRAQFFDPRRGCLFDVLTPAGHGKWRAVPEIRPNQIFAVALTHSALTPEQQKSVVACVRSKLLTPVGLRTLDPADPRYVGRFEGDLFHRDGAYHNGTVWPWLIGPFIEASLRAENFSEASRAQAMRDLSGLIGLVRGLPAPKESSGPSRTGVPRSVGTIAEVFDGDEPAPDSPRRADGCMAQAWSVAECLRALSLIRSSGKDRAPTSSPAATATSGPAIESKAPAGKPVRT